MSFFSDKENRNTFLAYLVLCIVWGSTYLVIRIGVREVPPALFAGFRFLIAGLIIIGFAKLRGLQFPTNTMDLWKVSLVGIFLLAGGNGFVVWAGQWVHSGTSSLFIASAPLFMALLEMLLPGNKKLGAKGWVGLLVGFLGVILLIITNSGTGAINLKGAVLLIAAPLCWSIGSVYSKSFKSSGHIVSNIGLQMFAGGLLLTLTGLCIGELGRLNLTIKGVMSILYLVLFGSILAYSCYIYLLQKWPAAKAGTYTYVNPAVALFLGSVVLDEPFTISIVLCSAVILIGVFLVQTSKVKAQAELKECKQG